jgi:hypothetical protein
MGAGDDAGFFPVIFAPVLCSAMPDVNAMPARIATRKAVLRTIASRAGIILDVV